MCANRKAYGVQKQQIQSLFHMMESCEVYIKKQVVSLIWVIQNPIL